MIVDGSDRGGGRHSVSGLPIKAISINKQIGSMQRQPGGEHRNRTTK